MDQNPSSSSSKRDRKTIEKERRNEMKALFSQLSSLVPYQSDKEVVSLADQIDAAANYIKKLQETIEKNRQKKNNLIRGCSNPSSSCEISPRIEIRSTGPALEVVLVTWISNCQFMFSETLRILHEEEGLEVETASFSIMGNVVFHTIHSKIGEESALEHGAASRVSERLRRFVRNAN